MAIKEQVRLDDRFVIRTYQPRDQDQIWNPPIEGLRDTRAALPDANPKWDEDLLSIEEIYLAPGCNFRVVDRQPAARRRYDRNGYELAGVMPIPPLTLFSI